MSIISSVALGWLGRRVLDWGGIAVGGVFGLIQFYNSMPPAVQQFVQQSATGHWKEITLGTLPGVLMWAWSQFQSYKATVRPQIVTAQGEKVSLEQLTPTDRASVTNTAQTARKDTTILDALLDKLNRSRS